MARRPLFALLLRAVAPYACGGRVAPAGGDGAQCPPGYICEPACPAGYLCVDPNHPGGGSSGGTSFGGDAGAPSGSGSGAITGSTSEAPPPPTGIDGGYPVGSVPPAASSLSALAYRVVDAKFSAALSSIVMVSDTPSNALHVYDTSNGEDRAVALPAPPVAVAVDATGLLAAVAFDAHVSWVDLKARTVKATCDVTSNAFDVALSTKGVAYVMPRTDQWLSLHVIDLATCTESGLMNGSLYAGERLGLHPSEEALFAAENGFRPAGSIAAISRAHRSSAPTPKAAPTGASTITAATSGSARTARAFTPPAASR